MLTRPRSLALVGLFAALAVGVAVVAAAGRLGEADDRVATEAAPPDTTLTIEPPRFSKEANVAPSRSTPAAPPDSTEGAGGAGAGAGLAAAQEDPSSGPAGTTSAPSDAGGGAPGPAEGAPPPPPPPPPDPDPPASGVRCIVRLHGKGGGGSATYDAGGVLEVAPTGNASAWGGREWRYFPESGYAEARGSVVAAADAAGCGAIIVDGFSNGGAFAAKLFCRGENFGGRLVGVVVDDPVVDHAVQGCRPAAGVRVALYWTGALEATAAPGWDCAEQDWTCEGGTTIGIGAYEAALGTQRIQSPHGSHTWYQSAPELRSWW